MYYNDNSRLFLSRLTDTISYELSYTMIEMIGYNLFNGSG